MAADSKYSYIVKYFLGLRQRRTPPRLAADLSAPDAPKVVVYNLSCDNAHEFEGWFASPEAFEHQHVGGQVYCPVCGSSAVAKRPSAPYLNLPRGEPVRETAVTGGPDFMAKLRAKVIEFALKHTEDVGERFPEEARQIHGGEAPERAIRGQASRQEVEELREEGIEVIALPVAPVPPEQLH